MNKKIGILLFLLVIVLIIIQGCRKSFDIGPYSSKLTVSIGQVDVYYSMGLIRVIPVVENVYIPRTQKLGICWALNASPTVASSVNERNISVTAQFDPTVTVDGFDINFTKDTIYIVKAFVKFNDSLIVYSESRTVNLKDFH